jgi:hypothetical protein
MQHKPVVGRVRGDFTGRAGKRGDLICGAAPEF